MTTLELSPEPADRTAYRPLGNGKAEWAWRIGGALVAGLLAFGAVKGRVDVIEEREKNHYEEVLRRLNDISVKIDAIRR